MVVVLDIEVIQRANGHVQCHRPKNYFSFGANFFFGSEWWRKYQNRKLSLKINEQTSGFYYIIFDDEFQFHRLTHSSSSYLATVANGSYDDISRNQPQKKFFKLLHFTRCAGCKLTVLVHRHISRLWVQNSISFYRNFFLWFCNYFFRSIEYKSIARRILIRSNIFWFLINKFEIWSRVTIVVGPKWRNFCVREQWMQHLLLFFVRLNFQSPLSV